jgi:hypothetical protein
MEAIMSKVEMGTARNLTPEANKVFLTQFSKKRRPLFCAWQLPGSSQYQTAG